MDINTNMRSPSVVYEKIVINNTVYYINSYKHIYNESNMFVGIWDLHNNKYEYYIFNDDKLDFDSDFAIMHN
jgi:hypothetical protein